MDIRFRPCCGEIIDIEYDHQWESPELMSFIMTATCRGCGMEVIHEAIDIDVSTGPDGEHRLITKDP